MKNISLVDSLPSHLHTTSTAKSKSRYEPTNGEAVDYIEVTARDIAVSHIELSEIKVSRAVIFFEGVHDPF